MGILIAMKSLGVLTWNSWTISVICIWITALTSNTTNLWGEEMVTDSAVSWGILFLVTMFGFVQMVRAIIKADEARYSHEDD
jgi:membrane protein YdbS with pleckstrin-like domain